MKYLATPTVAKFECLQANCPDTCCKGWSMQLDDKTFAKYQGTELENAVAYDGSNNEIRVMKRDQKTDYCIKFVDGKCGIHATKGAELLGDACNFYPRVTRQFADQTIMTATLSCPEIARLALFESRAVQNLEEQTQRLPSTLIDYTPDGLNAESCLKVHNAFLAACDDTSASPERIVARIYSAATSLQYISQTQWPDAAGFMLRMADNKLPQAGLDKADFYKLLQIFAGIIHATGKQRNERLSQTLSEIEQAIGVAVDWETLDLKPTSATALDFSLSKWAKNSQQFAPILRKFVQSQLSFGSFPFAGLGANIVEKAKLLTFRFALSRLALIAMPENSTEEEIVRAVQSISRVLDHLADPTLTLNLFEEAGWASDAKIRGLIGDF